MTTDEVFQKLADHMFTGIVFHKQLSEYFCFLGFEGYSACQKSHFYEELDGYLKLVHYYMARHHKLLQTNHVESQGLIPQTWYGHSQVEVKNSTKQNAIKSGYESWIKWERETEQLYFSSYKDLFDAGSYDDAHFVKTYLCDVSNEIAGAEKEYLDLNTIGYDLVEIMSEQHQLYKTYSKENHEY